MKLSPAQCWAVRMAYRAQQCDADGGWTLIGGGADRHRPHKNTVRSLARLGLAELRRAGHWSGIPTFRLTIAGCLVAEEIQSDDKARIADLRAKIMFEREATVTT